MPVRSTGVKCLIYNHWICLFDVWNKSSKLIFLPNGGKKQKWWIFIPWENKSVKKHQQSPKNSLVGGFNPFEKYARQNGFIFPKVRGEHKKNIWVATTQNYWWPDRFKTWLPQIIGWSLWSEKQVGIYWGVRLEGIVRIVIVSWLISPTYGTYNLLI